MVPSVQINPINNGVNIRTDFVKDLSNINNNIKINEQATANVNTNVA